MTTPDRDKPKIAFDLTAVIREAGPAAEPIQFTYAGRRYSMTHLDELDGWEAVEIFGSTASAGQGIRMLEAAFGPEQWKAFKQESAGKLTKKGIDLLGKQYAQACGVDVGE